MDAAKLPSTKDAVAAAAAILRRGGLVGLPTETVYGLAADATNGRAVAAIYAAKGRPSFNPLIVHLAEAASAGAFGVVDARASLLAAAFWPGPLTLVLPHRAGSGVSDLARAGLESIALRVPAHPTARAIIAAAGAPLAAPSANRSGRVSPTTANDVRRDLGGAVDLVVEGGPATVGVESTIVSLLDGEVRLLRPGGVTRAMLEAVLGSPLAQALDAARPQAPGMLASHYAPDAPVRLDAANVRPEEALLAFGSRAVPEAERCVGVLNLSPKGDLAEAAANLFTWLRRLDALAPAAIAAQAVPMEGLGEAINDRLRRAAVR